MKPAVAKWHRRLRRTLVRSEHSGAGKICKELNFDMTQFHLGVNKLYPGMKKLNLGVSQFHHGVKKLYLGMTQFHLWMRKSYPVQGN